MMTVVLEMISGGEVLRQTLMMRTFDFLQLILLFLTIWRCCSPCLAKPNRQSADYVHT